MTRLLKIDPRPPSFGSIAEATLDDRAAEQVIDDVEAADWHAIAPNAGAAPRLAFVDGVQQVEARISAEGEGWPVQGRVVSYAAGAALPGASPWYRHIRVERRVILGDGRRPDPIVLNAHSGAFTYEATSSSGKDEQALDEKLSLLRAELEADTVRELASEGIDLIVVDGRLPPVTLPQAVGLIKTPHRVPITKDTQLDVLARLRTGERSPVFVRKRSDRSFYSWFVCLRSPGAHDLSLSGLALLEMDDSVSESTAFSTADTTAYVLPSYASSPHRDDRAPQNLLPVGQLERELRHRLGDAELLRRLMLKAFAKESPSWEQ